MTLGIQKTQKKQFTSKYDLCHGELIWRGGGRQSHLKPFFNSQTHLLAPRRKHYLHVEKMEFFERSNFSFCSQNAIWKFHYFWQLFTNLHKPLWNRFWVLKWFFAKIALKKCIFQIKCDVRLCKCVNTKKTENYKYHFVGKTKNFYREDVFEMLCPDCKKSIQQNTD